MKGADLARFPLLAALADAEREALARVLESLEFEAGARLFDAGDPADGLLLVADGRIALSSEAHAARGEFGPGETFGAISLVSEGRRAARAETLSRSRVLRLGRDAFRRFSDAQPRAACRVLEALLREQSRITHEAAARMSAAPVDRPAAGD
ncbi:MAG TPA: cyclic nucleotide-binding domain-containing protein [Myxococcota bacterium]